MTNPAGHDNPQNSDTTQPKPNTATFYDENGNPINVPFVVQTTANPRPTSTLFDSAKNFAGKAGRTVQGQLEGQEGSIMWFFAQVWQGIKLVFESINDGLNRMNAGLSGGNANQGGKTTGSSSTSSARRG